MTSELVLHSKGQLDPSGGMVVPAIIADEGDHASRRFLEFFVANISNLNTRSAYARAVGRFCAWRGSRHLGLKDITPMAVAAYIEQLAQPHEAPTVKQHLAAIRMLFDWLVIGQVVPNNPAASVRGPKHVVKKGKTLALSGEQGRELLESIPIIETDENTGAETTLLLGLRDRALIAAMIYSFARVSAVVNMDVEDYWQNGKRWWLRLHEKGGKHHEVPAHHMVNEYLDAYLQAAGIASAAKTALFRSADRKSGRLTERRMDRRNVLAMVKRCAYRLGCRRRRAAIRSAPPVSPPTWATKARSKKRRRSPRTSRRGRRSCTTARATTSRSMRLSGS